MAEFDDELKKFVDNTKELILGAYKALGRIEPTGLILMKKDGEYTAGITLLNDFFVSKEAKYAVAQELKKVAIKEEVLAFCLASEAYALAVHKDAADEYMDEDGNMKPDAIQAKDHPNSIDVVMFSFQTYDKVMFIQYKIDPKTKELTLMNEDSEEWTTRRQSKDVGIFDRIITQDFRDS